MVGKRKVDSGISDEMEREILPGLGTTQPATHSSVQVPSGAASPASAVPLRQPDVKTAIQQDSGVRRKVTLYLDDPHHVDLMDDLLSALKRFGLPRDNSMLVRALLNQASDALTDPEKLQALADACAATPTKR